MKIKVSLFEDIEMEDDFENEIITPLQEKMKEAFAAAKGTARIFVDVQAEFTIDDDEEEGE